MHRALYRKWRPQKFSDVVGQEAITTALANQIRADKIGHAYLFTGTRGTGKTTCAKIFAKAANCEARVDAEPCGACALCRGMEDGSVLDVSEIDAASNNGVDDVRDLREETAFRPSRGRYRVYIIDEVHMLSTAAFNALLKILEEPPEHVIFILATTEIHKVPATILSRCQRFDFLRISAERIAGRLAYVAAEEGIHLQDTAADLIARLADGSMRDALSLLDTCVAGGNEVDEATVRKMAGVADKTYLFEMGEAARAGNVGCLMELVAHLHSQSMDARRLCEELIFHYRNLILTLAKPDASLLENIPASERAAYVEAAQQTGEAAAITALQRLAAAMDKMGRSPDPRIELELALFELCEKPALQVAAPPAEKKSPVISAAASMAPRASAAFSSAGAPVAAPAMPVMPQPEAVKSAAPVPPEEDDTPPFDVEVPTPEANRLETEDADKAPVAEKVLPSNVAADMASAQDELKAETPPPAPIKQPVPVAADGAIPFEYWSEVLHAMAGVDRLLSSYMEGSHAYVDGNRVLIDGGDMFLSFVRENDFARERIKTVIQQVCGHRYGIGPYEAAKKAKQNEPTVKDTLNSWQALGVDVRYE